MNLEPAKPRWSTWCGAALAAAAVLRLVSLGRLALTDNTESRYGGIGWEMFRTGDWVTPWVYIKGALVPFWGKPPLQFWLTSLSYHVFGVSEAAARAPSLVIGAALVAATVLFARRLWGARVGGLAGVILATSGLYFVLAGACVLDVPLAASVSAALMAFARFSEEGGQRRGWGLGFFVALGVGALAKGPIALVLVGLALVVWLTLVRRWRLAVELPWVGGIAVFLAVAAPWYALAERATPGFLQYFLVNEHVLRYVSHNYGDLYGSGRAQPYGASWVMLAGAFLPWTVLAVAALVRVFRGRRLGETLRAEPWLAFALVWGLTPAFFFTFARQMLLTYLLPGLPGLAVAAAVALDRWIDSSAAPRLRRWLAWHVGLLCLAGLAAAAAGAVFGAPTVLAIAVAAAVAAVAWLGARSVRRGDAAGLLGALGVGAAIVLGGAVFLLAPRIDEQHSAKTVLAEVYRDPAAKARPVLMPFGEEYSAAFYAEAVFGAPFEHRPKGGAALIQERLERGGAEIFLFKRKQWNRLEPTVAARLSVVAETPHWVAAEGKTAPGAGGV
ncbi:MAG: glycosyltransferase family 39 protein [Deltaproteobacteria bacterium]|nr:glycosyltransferase family 39 protein [Deltaproteobacteria bacterium]